MAFLGKMLGGGGDEPQATITAPTQHFDVGGAVQDPRSVITNGGMANPAQPQAGIQTTAQATPYAGASQDAHGVLSNGSGTIFNAHPGRDGQQVWSDTATGVIPGGQGTGPMATIAQPIGAVVGGIGQMGQNAAHGLGDTFQGIGSAFTAQNQYQAQLAPTTNYDYGNVIGQTAGNSLSGYGQFQQNQGQQQAILNNLQNTGNQYQNIANGTGPNPAQAALNQSTGQNVANQAALMAGQRGSGANVGLMARQAAMQGANTQQQAVGQAATLQANQQISGLQGLQANQTAQGQIAGQMGNQIQGEQGVNNNLFGTATGANTAQNNTSVANTGMVQGINAQVAQNNANAVNKTTAGLMGSMGSLFGMAEGGEVPGKGEAPESSSLQKAAGSLAKSFNSVQASPGVIHTQYAPLISGPSETPAPQQSNGQDTGPKSSVGKILKGIAPQQQQATAQAQAAPAPTMFAKGGKIVPAMVSPGEKYLSPREATMVAKGKVSPAHAGKVVPGHPKFKGNNYANDTVPAKLEAGGIVIPNSVMQSDDPERNAAAFVRAHLGSRKSALSKGKKK